MTTTDLPWTFFGRKIKPFSLALSLTMLQLAWSILTKSTIGAALDEIGQVVGMVAVVSFALLTGGFVFCKERWMVLGLLLASGAWSSAAAILWLDVGLTPSTASATCWVIAAGGAWLLETSQDDEQHP